MRTIVLGALALAVLPLSGTPSPAAPAEPEVSGAEAVVAAAARRGSVRLIARLARPADGAPLTPALATRRAADLATAMRAAGVTRVDSIRGLPLAVLEARPAQLAALLRSGLVEAVQEDVAVPPGLAQSVALVDAPRAWAAGASGTGWAVAVLDTGVDATHPFLAGRVVAEACFSSTTSVSTSVCPNGQGEQVGAGAGANCPATVAGCEHGTYVAGIAAGRDYTGGPGLNGVAPDAGIVPVQVFSRFEGQSCTNYHLTSPCALTWTSDQIKGLQQVAAFAATTKIAAVNMSLVSGLYLSSCDSDLRKPAIDALAALGIPTVVAAGNIRATSASARRPASAALSPSAPPPPPRQRRWPRSPTTGRWSPCWPPASPSPRRCPARAGPRRTGPRPPPRTWRAPSPTCARSCRTCRPRRSSRRSRRRASQSPMR